MTAKNKIIEEEIKNCQFVILLIQIKSVQNIRLN